jgi:glycosyltransferase involved in cell wall biosynthesis
MHVALLFQPDGYSLDGAKLMGRQSAGNGLLRAAVAGREGDPMLAYTSNQASFDVFRQMVGQIDASANAFWIPYERTDWLARAGILFRPDHAINVSARARLYRGMAAYSLCGQTHTLCTDTAFQHLFDLASAPVAPWDAIICTSSAARDLIRSSYARQADYLAWKFGTRIAEPEVQLPIIPLGVHVDDFAASEADKARARHHFGIANDEIVALFAGRLSFNGKAHPVAMYRALQAAAVRTGRRLVLIEAGIYPNDKVGALYDAARRQHMPGVRSIVVPGRDFDAYRMTWQAADLFLCLSDSIQETFGLTPVEAMAAGLPVLVSDWNGYKDTVRDGIDGFRIPTWAPAEGGEVYAHDYAAKASDLDLLLACCGGAVAINQARLIDRLSELVDNADLRERLGAAGQVRARASYDWAVIFAQYRALWSELAAIRGAYATRADWLERLATAPRCHPHYPDPFSAFAHYPTATIDADVLVEIDSVAPLERYASLSREPLHRLGNSRPETVKAVIERVTASACTVGEVARSSGLPTGEIQVAVGRLAKLGLVRLRSASR